MKLASQFIRLPFTFDVQRLVAEVAVFNDTSWMPHPQNYTGNYSIPLVSVNGQNNDDFNGPMVMTNNLRSSPYMQQIIASFGEVIGRSRLMRLDANSQVPPHADINYHWYQRVRIHIPIISNDEVEFFCGDKSQKMKAGECWLLDTWERHHVENRSDQRRIHLVVDTAGSAKFWRTVRQILKANQAGETLAESYLPYVEGKQVQLFTERFNAPKIMSPGEVDGLIADLTLDANNNQNISSSKGADELDQFISLVSEFRHEWRRVWSLFGDTDQGAPYYRALLQQTRQKQQELSHLSIELASNKQPAVRVFNTRVLVAALNETL